MRRKASYTLSVERIEDEGGYREIEEGEDQ
jgi:hypothetical protein